jgi:hypothetical protein
LWVGGAMVSARLRSQEPKHPLGSTPVRDAS